MDSLEFYRSFHNNPINKLIHAICIPLIILTLINLLAGIEKCELIFHIQQPFKLRTVQTYRYYHILLLYLLIYLINYGIKFTSILSIFFGLLLIISNYWRKYDNLWYRNSWIIFIAAWIMQFIGHAIEGNRPALVTSLTQSVFQAPIYTLEYYYPGLFI